MKGKFKKRILALAMLATFLQGAFVNNLMLPHAQAVGHYHGFNTQPVQGLLHPLDVEAVRTYMHNELRQYVNWLNNREQQHGRYMVITPASYDDVARAVQQTGQDDVLNLNQPNFKRAPCVTRRTEFDSWGLEPLSDHNFIPTTIADQNQWRNFITFMEASKPIVFVPDGGDDQDADIYFEVHRLPILSLKTGAFAMYLHQLSEDNPTLTPRELLQNDHVGIMLDRYWNDMLWVENTGGGGIMNSVNGMLTSFGFGDAIGEFLAPMNIKRASTIALSVYYDSANWYQRVKYKLGKWGAFGVKAFATAMAPLAAWRFGGWMCDQIGNIVNGTSKFAKDEFLAERNKVMNDPIKLRAAIKKMMQDGVVGLTDTIEKLTTMVTGNLALRKSKSLINRNRCQLISFIGPPGMGKSLLAQKYAMALTGKPIPSWGYITSASLKPGVSPVDQFFDVNSDLIKNLKRCKGNTVLFFDEIDKYKDSNALLECLRDAVDRGTIEAMSETSEQKMGMRGTSTAKVVNKESIDVSGLIVIVGTNEKPECWGLEPDPDEPAYNVGRTVVERSGSLVQRFQRFKFNPYKVDEYKQMYDRALKSIFDESEKMFGLKVVFDPELSKTLARESEHRMMGGRSVAVVLSEMAGAITSLDIDENEKAAPKSLQERIRSTFSRRKPRTVHVSFNFDTHKFVVKQVQQTEQPKQPEQPKQISPAKKRVKPIKLRQAIEV